MRHEIDQWLVGFNLHDAVRDHAAAVMQRLPDEVLIDLMGEAGVLLYDYDPGPGVVMQVPVRIPDRNKKNSPSRSVVLKRTIRFRGDSFARWLIAHELAHSFLRNAGRWPGEDPEAAADALAREWGFPRPG